MTPFEKVIAAFILMWFLAHAAVKWGAEAGIPATLLSLAERAVIV